MALSDDGAGPDLQPVTSFDTVFVTEYPRMVAPAADTPVWRAVAELPRQQRAVVALRFLEDQTIEEIADILDISPSTARVHLHRARQTLRDRLDEAAR